MSENSDRIYWSIRSMLKTTMPILLGMAVLGIIAGIILESLATM